jgi:hypothetical protein
MILHRVQEFSRPRFLRTPLAGHHSTNSTRIEMGMTPAISSRCVTRYADAMQVHPFMSMNGAEFIHDAQRGGSRERYSWRNEGGHVAKERRRLP